MSDLWTEATYDAEAEKMSRLVVSAKVAVAEHVPFLTAATSAQDYANRKALITDRLDQAVATLLPNDPVGFGVVRSSLEASLDEDYRVMAAARAEQARVAALETAQRRQAQHRAVQAQARRITAADFQRSASQKTAGRYEVKKDSVHSYWGIWDTQEETWHEGDYPDAVEAAGIPMWDSEAKAKGKVESLNSTASKKTFADKGGSPDPAAAEKPEEKKGPQRQVDLDPETQEWVGSEWEESEDPATLVQTAVTFGKNPRFKTQEEADAWVAEGAKTEDTTKADSGPVEQPQSDGNPFAEKKAQRRTAGQISWSATDYLGIGYLKGKAANGDTYEVYHNPNNNPTPCTWINYGDRDPDNSGPGDYEARGSQYASMAEAVAAAEADAAGRTAKRTASDLAGRTLIPDFEGSAYCWYGPGRLYGDDASEVGFCEGPTYWVGGESPRSGICAKHARQLGWLTTAAKTAAVSDLDDAALDKELRRVMEQQNNTRSPEAQESLRSFRRQLEDEQKKRKGGGSTGGGQERDGEGKFASAKTAGYEGWGMQDNPNFPGEKILACPKCGGFVTMTGTPLSDPYGRGTTLTCQSCGFSQFFNQTGASKKTASWADQARGVVTNHQFTEVDGMILDATTASMLVQILDALSADNKAKFEAMPLAQAVDFGWKLLNKATATRRTAQISPRDAVAQGEAGIRQFLMEYAWAEDTEEEKKAAVDCIMAQGDWQHIDAVADNFAGAQEEPGPAAYDSGLGFALSALYEAHDGPHIPSCPSARTARRKTAAGSTYEVKKIHSDTWLPGGESTEEAGEVIKANVTGSEEEFWLVRNNFNGVVNVYAYHGAMKGIDSSMPPRNMGTYEQFYGQPYIGSRRPFVGSPAKVAGSRCPSCGQDEVTWTPVIDMDTGQPIPDPEQPGEVLRDQSCSNCDWGVGNVERYASRRRTASERREVYRGTSVDYDTDGDGPPKALLESLIGKYVTLVLFNEHGVAADYDTGRILDVREGHVFPEVEWKSDSREDSYPLSADGIYRITRLEEPGDPAQMSLFAFQRQANPYGDDNPYSSGSSDLKWIRRSRDQRTKEREDEAEMDRIKDEYYSAHPNEVRPERIAARPRARVAANPYVPGASPYAAEPAPGTPDDVLDGPPDNPVSLDLPMTTRPRQAPGDTNPNWEHMPPAQQPAQTGGTL